VVPNLPIISAIKKLLSGSYKRVQTKNVVDDDPCPRNFCNEMLKDQYKSYQ